MMPRHLMFLAALGVALGNLRAEEPSLADLTVPVGPGPAVVKQAEQTPPPLGETGQLMQQLLERAKPIGKMKPTALISDRHYILYGDLFHTGESYALVQIDAPKDPASTATTAEGARELSWAALALWEKGGWTLRGLWRTPVTWRPEGWQPTGADSLPDVPATKAFELKDLSGDGVPEVIVAGDVGDAYQNLYVLRFDPKAKTLRLLASSQDEPMKMGRYVMLYDRSAGHPIWADWKYYEWKGADLVPVAVWHDQVPFDGVGDTFMEATAFDQKGAATKYHIVEGKESPKENDYTITRNGEPYATLSFTWRKAPDDNDVPSYAGVERAYLFRKLLGLPMSAYPLDETNTPPAFFEKYGTLKVSGTDEAVKRLEMEKGR